MKSVILSGHEPLKNKEFCFVIKKKGGGELAILPWVEDKHKSAMILVFESLVGSFEKNKCLRSLLVSNSLSI